MNILRLLGLRKAPVADVLIAMAAVLTGPHPQWVHDPHTPAVPAGDGGHTEIGPHPGQKRRLLAARSGIHHQLAIESLQAAHS